jgi:hypothetical protein
VIAINDEKALIMNLGENNANYNRDKYTCTFSKLIEHWRAVWFARTSSITEPTFPFGFVQVRYFLVYYTFRTIFLSSYPQMNEQVRLLVGFLGFVGTKHLMLVMCLIPLYQMSSWQWP